MSLIMLVALAANGWHLMRESSWFFLCRTAKMLKSLLWKEKKTQEKKRSNNHHEKQKERQSSLAASRALFNRVAICRRCAKMVPITRPFERHFPIGPCFLPSRIGLSISTVLRAAILRSYQTKATRPNVACVRWYHNCGRKSEQW